MNRRPFLEAAAIAARHTAIPHRAGCSIGRSLRMLSTAISGTTTIDPVRPDGIARRLTTLISLDVDEAADMLSQLIGQAKNRNVGFDFRAIGTALLLWGDGIDDRSVKNRNNLLADYYYTPRQSWPPTAPAAITPPISSAVTKV